MQRVLRAPWPLRSGVPGAGVLGGAALTIVASYAAVALGIKIGLVLVAVVAVYIGSIVAFLVAPEIALAGTVWLFTLVPMLKVFVDPGIGGVKDVVVLAATTAMAIRYVTERPRADRWVITFAAVFLAIYVINPGHAHNGAWAQGVRLIGEPVLLLLVGLLLPNPVRCLRYAIVSLIGAGCFVALYGLLQQLIGPERLVSLGYSYSQQVRTIGSLLRSFGTFDDPFAYATYLAFAFAAAVFWMRRSALAWVASSIILLGLAVSYVRTAALYLAGYATLELVRRGKAVTAAFLTTALSIIAIVILINSSGTATTTYTFYSATGGALDVQSTGTTAVSEALNGRVSAWTAALGSDPFDWFIGRGVGTVGTAAARATYTFTPGTGGDGATAVDSGYFATMADVGLVGLAVQLALFGRLLVLASRHARARRTGGWLALALLVCMLLDALTRASFTGFPTAFLGLLLVGVALAACEQEASEQRVPGQQASGQQASRTGRVLPEPGVLPA